MIDFQLMLHLPLVGIQHGSSSDLTTPYMLLACSTEFDQGYGIEKIFGLRFASRAQYFFLAISETQKKLAWSTSVECAKKKKTTEWWKVKSPSPLSGRGLITPCAPNPSPRRNCALSSLEARTHGIWHFLPPVSLVGNRIGAVCLSVCVSVCVSVCLLGPSRLVTIILRYMCMSIHQFMTKGLSLGAGAGGSWKLPRFHNDILSP